jgi:hypothetical protein
MRTINFEKFLLSWCQIDMLVSNWNTCPKLQFVVDGGMDGQTDRHDKANIHFSQFCERT